MPPPCGSIENFTGIQTFLGIERVLDLAHQFVAGIAELLAQPRLSRGPRHARQ